jgi:hypothetical protein
VSGVEDGLRKAADWIEQHDPADELSWFIEELRAGLKNHPPGSCKDCYVEEPEEVCEVHDTPMTDGVCSSCLTDAAHNGR